MYSGGHYLTLVSRGVSIKRTLDAKLAELQQTNPELVPAAIDVCSMRLPG
jgi:hypothetical protein